MNQTMRMFRKREIFYVEFERGQRKSLRTKDEKQARDIFKEMEKEYLRGRLIQLDDVKRITLSEFQKTYIEKGREGLSKWTVKKDSLSLNLLADAIGNIQLRAITKSKIEDFKRICRTRGATETTINGYLRQIKAAFSWAIDEGYLKQRPKIKMYSRKVDRTQEIKNRVLAVEDIEKIMNKAREIDIELWRYFYFCLWTGARRREAAGLFWPEIRLDREECTLNGKTGPRTVPLLPPVIDALRPVRKDLGRVFRDYHADTWSHKFEEIAEAAGVKARLHDLRYPNLNKIQTFLIIG